MLPAYLLEGLDVDLLHHVAQLALVFDAMSKLEETHYQAVLLCLGKH